MNNKIDACISYYGKPYQTMVTILTLLKHSEERIGKIFLSVEKIQPNKEAWNDIANIKSISSKIEVFFCKKHLPWMVDVNPTTLSINDSINIRYEYALRNCKSEYLLILHNDMLIHSDLLGKLISKVTEYEKPVAGIGYIGQCWNCPAFTSKLCNSTLFPQFKPTQQEALELYKQKGFIRTERSLEIIKSGKSFPLPECRLNEHFCLINTSLYREVVLPKGDTPYFGGVWDGSDTGAAWFYSMISKGYHFINYSFENDATHGSFCETQSGTASDTNQNVYANNETKAKKYMENEFKINSFSSIVMMKGVIIKFLNTGIFSKLKNFIDSLF
jgi:hypothetical protein